MWQPKSGCRPMLIELFPSDRWPTDLHPAWLLRLTRRRSYQVSYLRRGRPPHHSLSLCINAVDAGYESQISISIAVMIWYYDTVGEWQRYLNNSCFSISIHITVPLAQLCHNSTATLKLWQKANLSQHPFVTVYSASTALTLPVIELEGDRNGTAKRRLSFLRLPTTY